MSPKFESAEAIERSFETGARNLRVVEAPPYYREEIGAYYGENGRRSESGQESHSLNSVVGYPESFHPEMAAYLIGRYSKKGDIVLDPFCGGGTTGLEANLLGRIAYLSDVNPVAVRIAQAKTNPADLAEVTLALQRLQLKRPVEMGPFAEVFQHFYDAETFRELANVRSSLAQEEDRISRFVQLVALSLLHGPSAGYFSTYTSPLLSLAPTEQQEVNHKRRQIPDYRAVMPRILRKTASILRDGIPSLMRTAASHNNIAVSDARNLHYIQSSIIDFVLAGVPLPCSEVTISDLWLKLWFLGLPAAPIAERVWHSKDLGAWLAFMNEACIEMARVVRGGGRAAFVMNDIRIGRSVIELDQEFVEMVSKELSRFWYTECILVHRDKGPTISGSIRNQTVNGVVGDSKVVIIRRR